MKKDGQYIRLALLTGVLIMLLGCSEDNPREQSPQEKQLKLLSETWKIESAMRTIDRTSDFLNPDFTLTIAAVPGNNKVNGPYGYSVSGTTPDPSPWALQGLWTFGTDINSLIIRDDNVEIHYQLEDDKLTLVFSCITCDEDNGRLSSTDGEWVFVFTR